MQTYPKEFENLIINIIKVIRDKQQIDVVDLYDEILEYDHVSTVTFDIAIEKLIKLTVIKEVNDVLSMYDYVDNRMKVNHSDSYQ